ncbi:hypothetical protein SAICODRAFT_33149 [Saitoella complicata NRRL Y-17804]|uniref:Zn(2)-C6 fungal-type domain-containing protein n=1 Tax=Saitoella complicata (strain BCRC 22490 / CBS 7301 / JCM 7358 / NBRC 10748 / NRRL Y-17804) TaxID=698492 RepID=A0A0E9NBC4_SAICN|nr:uncharacterized protein SAICODRAFT_33149 [Saitoella complicata NRRL Y-17804]ODQ55791.1 hypothetical protein SAICODRAFT_33149 [Saitoella complicata NRRL Y-17804]GAO46705.1 hypothetical protein G7K_0928-t1 [Saitoella complicata NRRL Y-17804]
MADGVASTARPITRTTADGGRACDRCRRMRRRCQYEDVATSCVLCHFARVDCTKILDPPPRPGTKKRKATEGGARATSEMSVEPAAVRTLPGMQTGVAAPEHVDDSLGLIFNQFSELYGLSSDMEPILMRHRPYHPAHHEFRMETHAIRRVLARDNGVEYPLTFHMVSDTKAIGHDQDAYFSDAIEQCVQPHGPRLVDLFFRIAHPSYPVLDRERFLGEYNKSYKHVLPALLGAVYLLALNWFNYDRELWIRSKPDTAPLRKLVIEAVQNSYHRPKLSCVQAMLLFLQCKPEDPLNPDHTYARSCTSQLLVVGEALGLHLDAEGWSIPAWEKKLRKRLSWALFMQDKWTAAAHGRPSHIHYDDWAVRDITLDDLLENNAQAIATEEGSTNVWQGLTEYREMVKLSQITADILHGFYTVRSSVEQETVKLYLTALPVLGKLDGWYAELPDELRMEASGMRLLSPNGYLHLSYFGTRMTLLRRIIRSTALPPVCRDTRVLTESRDLARRTADAAIDFVVNLRADHLEAFWYFTTPFIFSLIGSFVTLLLVTARSESERAHWREKLNRYLWSLRLMGNASEPMRYAGNRLEGAILRGLEHALAVDVGPSRAPTRAASPEITFEDLGSDFGLEGFDFLQGMHIDWSLVMPEQPN